MIQTVHTRFSAVERSVKQSGLRSWFGAVFAAATLLVACASPSASSGSDGASAPVARPEKTVRMVLRGEPNGGIISYGVAGNFSTLEYFFLFHASLSVYDAQGDQIPRLAQKLPTLADGDWKTFPDGRMEVTWKLNDTRWQDGAPLTAEDFAFGLKILSDPQIPISAPAWTRLVSGVETPDSRTLIVKWNSLSYQGGGIGTVFLNPLPKHLLSDLYAAGDIQAFLNSPLWFDGFVGLGPYQVTRWERGSFLEGRAHAGYVLGSPKIDRIIISIVNDVNTIVARMVANDQDVVPLGATFDVNQMVDIQHGWGPGVGYADFPKGQTRTVYWQLRNALAPWMDVRVRRAVAHATDRESFGGALNFGVAADTFIPPNEAAFRTLDQRGFAKYPYDLTRARQLLAEAGWTPDGQGVLRDRSGQVLSMDVRATDSATNINEIVALSAMWKTIGVQAEPKPIGPADRDMLKNTFNGAFVWPGVDFTNPTNLLRTQIATEQNVWKGSNYAAYNNPTHDGLYDRFAASLRPEEQNRTLVDMMVLYADEVPVMPIIYYGNAVVAREGLVGPRINSARQSATSWDVHTWDFR